MRNEFAQWIEQYGRQESRLIFLTGDLGYGALENVQAALGPRFVNMGVSEQNMVSVAAGLARQGLLPLCYSIAPFVVYRCLEQFRNDACLHNLPVFLVGNGGGYGYGIMGSTHLVYVFGNAVILCPQHLDLALQCHLLHLLTVLILDSRLQLGLHILQPLPAPPTGSQP